MTADTKPAITKESLGLEEMAAEARELSNKLFSNNLLTCARQADLEKESCLQQEERRPLTKEEKSHGWERRPFFAYDSERMCAACAAYYHAERAAQLLHQIHCIQVKYGSIKGEEKT